jgi:beta-N-acetylhexosaminidase
MAVALGLQQRGVAACGKHFPGHGAAKVDSHVDLPVLKLPKRRLRRVDMLPFRRAATGGVAALMPGHLLVPGLDPERPASLSAVLLKGVVRDEWGFPGVVVTDDLEMAAVAGRYDLDTMLRWGLEAEVDVFLFCRRPELVEAAIDRLCAWARDGSLPAERLARSYARIAALKAEFPPPAGPLDPAVLGAPAHRRLVEVVQETAAGLT